MNLESPDKVKHFLRTHLVSAGLSTALELGLFHWLANKPKNTEQITNKLGIPIDRTQSLLDLLVKLDLLEQVNERYQPSTIAFTAIINPYSQDTWKFYAQGIRERYIMGNNLALTITHSESVWKAQNLSSPNWFAQINNDSVYSRRFTHMLYELHSKFAEELSHYLDLKNINNLLDIGGGSGVISLALLKQNPGLTATVIDIPSVCVVGREIASETSVMDRINYLPLDFLQEELPTGFDRAIECDVGIYSVSLFEKIYQSLNTEGRFLLIENIDNDSSWVTPHKHEFSLHQLVRRFESSLQVSKLNLTTIDEIKELLLEVGFRQITTEFMETGTLLIQADK